MIVQRESEYRKIQKLWINSTKVVDTTGMQYLRPLHHNALASKHDCDRLFWDVFSTFRPLRFLLFDLVGKKDTNHKIPLCLPSISIVGHPWLLSLLRCIKHVSKMGWYPGQGWVHCSERKERKDQRFHVVNVVENNQTPLLLDLYLAETFTSFKTRFWYYL